MTLFAALSADQMATVEDAVADPFPLALSRYIEEMERTIVVGGLGRVVIAFAGATVALERLRDNSAEATVALRNLGPIAENYPRLMLDAKPVANPRAPIPAAVRRRNRDRWQ